MTTDLRYPIGRFTPPDAPTPDDRSRRIDEIAGLPGALRAAVGGLSPEQLDTAYRPGGWTVRQVVHHVPDSHINAYVRFRLALTEREPTIRPYEEARWAELDDARTSPPDVSLALLDALHDRWVTLLRALPDDAWPRILHHPESGVHDLDWLLALYAWHGRHHVAHVTALRERMGW